MYYYINEFINITNCNGDKLEKYKLNQNINNFKNNDNKICCPKIFHYYWDDFKKFSFMNLYSLRTSLYYHQDYIHIIWTPTKFCEKINWKENLNNNFIYDDNYEKYVKELKNYNNLLIIKLDINNFLGIESDMSEIHKSDILRYVLLNRFGGIWSDLDIVYIKKITDKINFDFENLFFKCVNGKEIFYPIGLLLCKKNTSFMNKLLDNINEYYNKNKYQCIGAEMLKKIFTNKNYKDVYFLGNEFYMNYLWYEIDNLFINYKNNIKDLKNTIGFHWFNGSNITKKYISNIKNEIIKLNYNGIIFIEKNKFLR
jgi:mannosyltransferase OCH1-like enzyme